MASAQDLFGQLWKEYALSDSRYMTSDTLVLCMETMTVVSPTTIYKTNRIHRWFPQSSCGDHCALLLHTWPQPGILCATQSRSLCAWAICMATCCIMRPACLTSMSTGDHIPDRSRIIFGCITSWWTSSGLLSPRVCAVPGMSIKCWLCILDYLYQSISTISAALKQSGKDKTK
jgi:hypothetical protein